MLKELVGIFKRRYISFIEADNKSKLKSLMTGIFYYPFLFLAIALMLLLTIILELLYPLFKVHFRILRSERIATLAQGADLYLRRRAVSGGGKRSLDLIISTASANRYLMKLVKKKVWVLENEFLIRFYKLVRILIKDSKVWSFMPGGKNSFLDFAKVGPQLAFSKKDHLKGEFELVNIGIVPGCEFVCFHSRDKAYLDRLHAYRSRSEWAYHDFRDSDINNYLAAAEYLSALNIYAIRMGCVVEKPIKTFNSKIIDYAWKYRSDFMDIYLLGNCKFFLGCNAGLFCVAQAFGVPVAAANWVPIKEALVFKQDIFIPKKLWDIKAKRSLTFKEITQSKIQDICRNEDYIREGIELVENTGDEILALANEMNERIDGKWVETSEDKELQQRYRSLFKPGHFSYGFPSRIGAEFLRQNKELLE